MKTLRILLCVLSIPFSINGQIQFNSQEQPIYIQDFWPVVRAIHTGDLDSDGDMDIAATYSYSDFEKIVWFENIDNTGYFETPHILTEDINKPYDVFITDMDGDGDMDILSNSWSDDQILWLENIDGQGEFSDPIIFNVSNHVTQTIGVDIDADGDTDIVATIPEVVWFENTDGQGTFGTEQTLPGSGNIHFADIDADGDLDLVTASDSEDQVKWYENTNGQGAFGSGIIAAQLNNPKDAFSGDVDGDGHRDLIVGTNNSDELVWYKNEDGLGNFGNANIISSESFNCDLVKGVDFDQDGDLDIVANVQGEGGIVWYENLDGQGTYSDAVGVTGIAEGNISLVTDDLNGDDFIDILVGFAYGSEDRFLWYENLNGTDAFSQAKSVYIEASGARDFLGIDIDGDGDNDCVSASRDDDKIAWYRNEDGLGNFGTQKIISLVADKPMSLAAGDLDGDGDVDILSASEEDHIIAWYENENGQGDFSPLISITSEGSNFPKVVTADLDGDNDLDVLFTSADSTISWCNNTNVQGNFSSPIAISPAIAAFKSFIAIDIDGDLDLDVAAIANNLIVWFENEGGAISFGSEQVITTEISGGSGISGGDIDGDGDIDLISSSKFDDKIVWYENTDGLGSFSAQQTITIDYDRPSAVRLVDLDNDNDLDVLFSTQYYTNLWCGAIENTDGQGNFGFVQPISAGSQSFGIVNHATVNYADFNGDGKTDAMALSGYNDKMVWFQNLLGYPSISGNCFIDYNENQIKDPDEVGWFSQRVNLSSNSLSNFSTTDGYYRFVVNDGDYVVSAPPEENWYLTTSPENYSVTVQDAQGAANLDFGFAPNEIFSEVEPSTSSTFTRCGFISMFWLNYTNTGTNFDSGFISFQFDELTTFVEADIQPDSIDNNTLFWNYNNLPPTFNEKIRIQLQMPDVDFIGDTVSFEARSFIVDDTGDAVLSKIDNYQSVINCAYDPNDKLVVPSGFTQEKLTLFEDELEYTIRFQNTGTDTAFTVNIKDQLDIDLDWSTFRPIAASHPYIVNLHNDGLVVFDFENIMLPDSNVNELESHGFVKYRIKSLDNLPENTEVHNYADICFDFNPPIQTNTTLNTLISAYPFEISDTIRHPICAGSEDGSIEIDLWAIEPVFYDWDNSNLSGPNNENLLAGTYEVTITDGTGGTAIQSFVLTEPPVLSATLSSTPQSSALFGTASVSPSGGTPPYSVQWSTNPPQSDTTVIDLVAGNYMVTIIDYNGCSYVDSINVGFLNNVTENKNRFDCIISPNPTTGGFSIGFSKPINADLIIEITNYAGKKVFEEKISGPVQSILHNQDQLNLSDGVYFINIKIEDQMLHKKIIILND